MKTTLFSGRPTVKEVNLGALEFNYRQIRKRIPKSVKLMGIVKADAYGHGAVPVSLRLEKMGVSYLGVSIPEEGVELRRGGVKSPILILGGFFGGEADQIFRYRLTPVIFRKDSLRFLSREAEKRKKKLKVHLKVDTGMGRLGVSLRLWPDFLKAVKQVPGIEVEGILSHFSMDCEEEDYTKAQWEEFQKAVSLAHAFGITCSYRHIGKSAAVGYPAYSADMVRPGIMLYGAYPSPSLRSLIPLKPVMTLKTRIHLLKSVPSGTKISYGGTFTAGRESLIATLPIGYADGYNRRLSNQGEVLIRGKRSPVVGKVCMDFIMVDVTDIPGASMGDEVILMGHQGKEQITAEEIAEKIGSISYEVFCAIGKRVPAVYKG